MDVKINNKTELVCAQILKFRRIYKKNDDVYETYAIDKNGKKIKIKIY